MSPALTQIELAEKLRAAGFPFEWEVMPMPSADRIAAELTKISSYLKIRYLPVGYFHDGEGLPLPASEEERWGAALSASADYTWQPTLWHALAVAYLTLKEVDV